MVPYPIKIVQESCIVAVQLARSSRPATRLQQNTDHCKCCVHVERHTLMKQMIGDGTDGSQRPADNPLPSTMVLVRLNSWKTRTAILNSTCCHTGSQWSCRRVGAARQSQVARRHSGPTVGNVSVHQPCRIIERYSSPIGWL